MGGIIKNIVVGGDTLTLTIALGNYIRETLYLNESYISSTKFLLNVTSPMNNMYSVFIKFSKITPFSVDETVQLTSKALSIKDCIFEKDRQYQYDTNLQDIDIKIQVIKLPLLHDLHDDEAMTDFELHADDGCVRFHRLVLVVSSPVLKTMLSGKWKETAQGHVEVPGISKNTIQQFKDYIYKNVVPENVSFELHSLASYYMMTELEEICAEKLADTLTSENIWSLLEYCASHKSANLMTIILRRVKRGKIDEYILLKGLNSEMKG